MGAISRLCHFGQRCDSDGLPPLGCASGEDHGIGRTRTRVPHQEACDVLVIHLAPLPRGFFLGTLGPFRFSLSGPMLRPRLRNLANEPLEAWPCIITATATKKTSFPSSSSVVLFAQMMFADQVYRTRLRSFFTELFREAHF